MNKRLQILRPILHGICAVSVLGITPSYAADKKEPIPFMLKRQDLVHGKVTDAKGEPVIGAVVKDKNSNKGTMTDVEGRFSLEVASGSTLIVSMIGYFPKEVVVSSQGSLSIQLQENSSMLNEVVAIGYKTMRKSDVTGAISSVKAEELNVTATTVGQSLVGKVAGVQVSQVSGAPYASTKIRVRGVGSVNASSDPLYVIDGYPAGNDVYINPNDIESIDILKDAASAAIYGSRAAGGVVLITTKRGKDGKGRLEYEYQTGIDQLSHKVDLMNASEFTQLLIDARNGTYKDLMVNAGKPWSDAMYSDNNATRVANVGSASSVSIPAEFYDFANQRMIAPRYDTDWQDELYRNAHVQRHNLSFSGGNDNARYYLSGAYLDQEGIMLNTGQERINFRANIDAKINPKLKVGASLYFTSNDNKEVEEGRFDRSPAMGALLMLPMYRAYDENGNLIKNEVASQAPLYGYNDFENPVALATEINISRKGRRGNYNANANYEILPDLNFKVNLGMQTYNEKYEYYRPTSLSSGTYAPYSPQAIAAARATAQTVTSTDKLAEFTLNYAKQLDKHRFDLLAGYTAQRTTRDAISVTARGFENDRIQDILGKGADPSNFVLNTGTGVNETGESAWTLLSYLARANYIFNNKYYVTASFRTDGSSRFGPLNKWGTFPSLSVGWNVSDEPFYSNLVGNAATLKLRASWGKSGNNNIGNYSFQQVLANPGGVVFGNGTISTALWAGDIRDLGLGWETTNQYNFGGDIGLFNGRVAIIANYYISNSTDLLFEQPLSAVSGSSSWLTNLSDSKIQNKGFDFQLDSRLVSTDNFRLTLSGNLSLNRNKVLDMGGASTIFSRGAERSYITHITQEGQPIGMFYGFKVAGMITSEEQLSAVAPSASSSNPLKVGDLYFEDVNNDGIVNDADKAVIGNPHPDFTYGFALTSSFKGFDFNAAFNGSHGNDVLDGQDYYLFNMEGSNNQYSLATERFRSIAEPGSGRVYRASRGGTQSNSTRLSTFYLQDGSFLRCTNITLGYNFQALPFLTKVGISNLRVYGSVNNAFTITNYLGYNPEVDYNNGANLTPGVDYGMYPTVRSYNMGIRVSF